MKATAKKQQPPTPLSKKGLPTNSNQTITTNKSLTKQHELLEFQVEKTPFILKGMNLDTMVVTD